MVGKAAALDCAESLGSPRVLLMFEENARSGGHQWERNKNNSVRVTRTVFWRSFFSRCSTTKPKSLEKRLGCIKRLPTLRIGNVFGECSNVCCQLFQRLFL